MRNTALQRGGHIVQSRCTQGSNQADFAWQERQITLAARVKQTFRFKLGLEPQKLLKQRALPRLLQAFHDQLQIATRRVHINTAAHFDQITVPRAEIRQRRGPLEHRTADLTTRVFQRKIAVTRRSP